MIKRPDPYTRKQADKERDRKKVANSKAKKKARCDNHRKHSYTVRSK